MAVQPYAGQSGNAFKVGSRHPDVSWAQKHNHNHKENTKKNMIQRRRNKRKNNIVRLGCLQPSWLTFYIFSSYIIYICPSVHQFWNIACFGRIAFECLCSNPPKLWHLFQSENPAAPVVAPDGSRDLKVCTPAARPLEVSHLESAAVACRCHMVQWQ